MMGYSSQYLEDCAPFFLEKLGFSERSQRTSDSCRLVEWVMPISATNDTAIELVVLYELAISDDPFVKTSENFHYYFVEVALKVCSAQAISARERGEGTTPFPEDSQAFLECGVLSRIEVRVKTKTQLKSLLKMLSPKHSP
jgi:hypothetical protein